MKKVDKKIKAEKGNWNFSGKVADQFVSHAEKSIPYYKEGHELILNYADYFCKKKSVCYELGSSTGEFTRKIASRFKEKEITVYGIDSEKNMIDFANKKSKSKNKNIVYKHANIVSEKLKKNDLIISYYTIHFIEPRYRQKVFDKIYKSLNWGGGFFLFEKVRSPDARFQDMSINLYNQFKLSKGFSIEEIHNKSESLKSVLEPFSTNANIQLMKRAGFKDITSIFKHICFEGFLAIK